MLNPKIYLWAVLGLLTFFTTGCATLEQMNDISELQNDEIVIVGRIELDPPLDPETEQNIKGIGTGKLKGSALFAIGNQFIDITEPKISDVKNYAVLPLEKDFNIRVPRHDKLIFSGASIMIEMGQSMYLPGGLELITKPSDKAIYIGTIRYYRDDYNEITKVSLIDDYKKTNKEFSEQFGDAVKLRKASFKPSK